MGQKTIPSADELQGLLIRIWSTGSHTDVHDVDARIFEALKILCTKRFRIGEPGWPFVPFEHCDHADQGKRVQHVQDRAFLKEIGRSRRIFPSALGEEFETSAIDHRSDERTGCQNTETFKAAATRYFFHDRRFETITSAPGWHKCAGSFSPRPHTGQSDGQHNPLKSDARTRAHSKADAKQNGLSRGFRT